MDVFAFRDRLIENYASYIDSFINIRDPRIDALVRDNLQAGLLWPDPLIQLNPAFEPGRRVDELVDEGVLHRDCDRVFRLDKGKPGAIDKPLQLHRHQEEAVRLARQGHNYVLTTGTGSGKSLAYIVPVVDHVLRHGSGRGITAIVVYPMNALANSQYGELEKFLRQGYAEGQEPVRFDRYTGQESEQEKARIIANPPDVLLTNYVMLELLLTRPRERALIEAAQGLRFLVLDELHTYRGRQGADVALLVRRVRDRLAAEGLQCVGTSATLAGSGSFARQREEVAAIASRLFGAPVRPEHVIGETLRRATPARDLNDPSFLRDLSARVAGVERRPPLDFDQFVADPLAIWIESAFGVTRGQGEDADRLVRATPRPLSGEEGADRALQRATGVPLDRCTAALRESLLAGYQAERHPRTNAPPFAFRLHQFISRGDTVYASLQPEAVRHVTMQGQQFVPGDRARVLLPLVFCRECGQEYYCVRRVRRLGRSAFEPRELSDREQGEDEDDEHAGFLYYSSTEPWPDDELDMLERVPPDWLEEHRGEPRVRRDRRGDLPHPFTIGSNGYESADGLPCHFVRAPFRFCLHCGVAYGARQKSDFGKLAALSSEGRGTATTITSLFAVRSLRQEDTLQPDARKLLSFTDNRQDAALQAGHFNDFMEIGQLRAALYRAVLAAGPRGLRHDELGQSVADALDLPTELYTGKAELRFQALRDAQHALREVLGYRLYRDLRRGWRVTAPNLEQCGLLEISYPALAEVCAAQDVWDDAHPALAVAAPKTRERIARALLDYMRRELAIKVPYLDEGYLERVQQVSMQHLAAPWALDENERLEGAAILFPRSGSSGSGAQDARAYRNGVFLSARGGFGQYLRRPMTFGDDVFRALGARSLGLQDTEAIIGGLLAALETGGLIQTVVEPKRDDEVPGYQLLAAAMQWVAGDGTRAFHDPIRVPNEPRAGGRTNEFFVEYYRTIAAGLRGVEAREHTAQVPYDDRLQREEAFRSGRLSVLYCSPTMELGVDIANLNVVNLRNVPPTPANYAQRSGRAGRNGQPALVFSYCSTGSSHDQYFFKRPERMVAGAVTPPRLDLSNEDLVRAHVQAIWLAETGLDLGKSLKEILDVAGEAPSLALLDSVREVIAAAGPKRRALERARRVLAAAQDELAGADWYGDAWLDGVLAGAEASFDAACERWRGLYRAALAQARAQDRIIRDASRGQDDKKQAEGLRREAEAQLKLLSETDNVMQSDFYSYRYFASEGFLPGYSFPRLPLSAFIPGRRGKREREEFLSRPRFLAISEFGPRAIVYHEGSRYLINKVILPLRDDDVLTRRAKHCDVCGYLHPIAEGDGPDLCQRCRAPLALPLRRLLRLQNVSTRRRDKINSDEEERFRLGYELKTGIRFEDQQGRPPARTAAVVPDGSDGPGTSAAGGPDISAAGGPDALPVPRSDFLGAPASRRQPMNQYPAGSPDLDPPQALYGDPAGTAMDGASGHDEMPAGSRRSQGVPAGSRRSQRETSPSLAALTYGHAATIWRINLGWKRRKNRAQHGFVLDLERGYWGRNEQVAGDESDPMSGRTERVIPYVEDRRNCLLFEPSVALDPGEMASLQAALKSAIQVEFQLEDNELAVEPLPDDHDRRLLLFYESAEGGAGVLRRLLDDGELARVARRALEICHFDPATGRDLRRAERAREDCEAACYDCLMTYGNQGDHAVLDRQRIAPLLLRLARARVVADPVALPITPGAPAGHDGAAHPGAPPVQAALAASAEPERSWLSYLDARGYRLPARAGDGAAVASCGARPDFLYDHDGTLAAVYVDGAPDLYPERAGRDVACVDDLEDYGYSVLRFGASHTWDALIARYGSVFERPGGSAVALATAPEIAGNGAGDGRPGLPDPLTAETANPRVAEEDDGFDPDLFDARWHPLLQLLARSAGYGVDAGGDVMRDGRVVGSYLAELTVAAGAPSPAGTAGAPSPDGAADATSHGDGGTARVAAIRLVDGDAPDAERVYAAVRAQGHAAVTVHHADPDGAMAAIQQAMGAGVTT